MKPKQLGPIILFCRCGKPLRDGEMHRLGVRIVCTLCLKAHIDPALDDEPDYQDAS